ncbi:MAG TPA: NnrS family protein, partial [Paracoccaceae bacterium]|nr:NnrS family protein [Paracoccaceae bacterium]
LLLVLHIGYLFLPLGALAMAIEILFPGILGLAGAQHLWMAGAIGLMTLAVMTRATLGHTGNPLTADRGTIAIYLLVIASVIARFLAGLMPDAMMTLYAVSGITWIGAFGWFSLLYGRYLMTPRPAR